MGVFVVTTNAAMKGAPPTMVPLLPWMATPSGRASLRRLFRRIAPYGFGIGSVAIAGLLTRRIFPEDATHLFELFQAAVVLTAWYGGVGPGIMAATLSFLVIDYFLIPPIQTFALRPGDLVRLITFEVVAVLTSLLSGKLKRANDRLVLRRAELEKRIAERTRELSVLNANLVREIALRAESERAILDISNREQRRLGQDLHDGLSQTLAGLRLMAERARQELTASSRPESDRIAMIEARLAEALAFVETVSRGLYPVELETNGLMAALAELAQKTGHVHPVMCGFSCPLPVALGDSAVANHVYRIAQEAVVNAVKGGKAGRIRMRLHAHRDRIVLSVADDGTGLGHAPRRKGMGMTLMENRARLIGGALRFRSGLTRGTVVRCSWPARNAPDERRHAR